MVRLRQVTAVLVASLVLAACGGGEDGPATAGSDGESSSDAAPAAPASESESEAPAADGAAAGTGTVTIGGTSYDFELVTSGDLGGVEALCVADGGTFGLRAQAADGSDTFVQAVFPPEEGLANVEVNVAVSSDQAVNWVAEEGFVPRVTGQDPLPPEQSAVTSVQVDVAGLSASGEAVFYNTVTEESADGTFAFTCP